MKLIIFNKRGEIMKQKLFFTLMFMLLTSGLAYANNTSLPFESALETIANSLSGPVAMFIGIAAFAVAGFGFAFMPDMNNLVKVLMGLCVALGIIFGGKGLIDVLFEPSSSGNVIILQESKDIQENAQNI